MSGLAKVSIGKGQIGKIGSLKTRFELAKMKKLKLLSVKSLNKYLKRNEE
ncbi:MAG: hypothetical protein PHF18_17375 [Methanosarcina sp.]|nr:hypothetical protein [Methanosarcina sp.]MDD3248603.1 hypothetical protein [Methanosarcina sp.]